MKLAFVYDAVYPWVKGGAEKRIYELGRRLVQQGHDVHVFGVKWWDGADVITNEGMVLHGVCGKKELYVHGRRSISEAVIFSIELIPHLFKEKFDLIDVSVFPYFSCFSVKLVSVLTRTPVIFTWHEVWGDYWYEYMGRFGYFGKLVESIVSKLTSKSIAVSEMTKNGLGSLGVSAENIRIVPNGIDVKIISSIKPSVDKCDIIFVGRLIKEKNADVLIEAMDHARKVLPDIKCHIIGDGPERERLLRLVSEYGLSNNVRFFGFMDYNDVIAHMKSSRALVIPSSREGFGMVVIEAYACGVPVITVRGPRNAACGLVNEKTGFVVNLDAKELGETICVLMNDAALQKKMSKSALDAAQDHDWDMISRRLMSVYSKLHSGT
ncbi:MAG: glycosyltransferase family 4 protein [Methanobacteriota archaeon]